MIVVSCITKYNVGNMSKEKVVQFTSSVPIDFAVLFLNYLFTLNLKILLIIVITCWRSSDVMLLHLDQKVSIFASKI